MRTKYEIGTLVKCQLGETIIIDEITAIVISKDSHGYQLAGGTSIAESNISDAYRLIAKRVRKSKMKLKEPAVRHEQV